MEDPGDGPFFLLIHCRRSGNGRRVAVADTLSMRPSGPVIDCFYLEARPGIEPRYAALQAAA